MRPPIAACGRSKCPLPCVAQLEGPEAHLVKLYRAGEHTVSELEELFPVTRSTIYRAIARAGGRTPPDAEAADVAA